VAYIIQLDPFAFEVRSWCLELVMTPCDGLVQCEDSTEPLKKLKVDECGFEGLNTEAILKLDADAIKKYFDELNETEKNTL
jgi:hypothetical protein